MPKAFTDFLNSSAAVRVGLTNVTKPLLDPWVFAMGLPIGDAYWANVKIEGKQQDVLIQPFDELQDMRLDVFGPFVGLALFLVIPWCGA